MSDQPPVPSFAPSPPSEAKPPASPDEPAASPSPAAPPPKATAKQALPPSANGTAPPPGKTAAHPTLSPPAAVEAPAKPAGPTPRPSLMERMARGLRRWRSVTGRWLASAYHDNALGLASQLSYDFLFLLAPGPLLVSAALSVFGTDPSTLASIIALLKNFLPTITHPIVDRQVAAIVVSGLGGKLALVGVLIAIYLGLNFVNTFTKSINHALGIHEMRRSWWSRSFIALLLLFWFSFTVLFGFNLVVFGEQVARTIVETFGLNVPLEDIVAWAKYPLIALALTGVAHTLYLLTPEVYQTSRQALPGAVFFALGWLFVTWLFRVYVEQYARYGEYYVSFASLAVLLTWIYVTSLLLLLGGWLNVVLRQESKPALQPAAA